MENRRVMRVQREIQHVMAEMLIHGLKVPLPGFASVVDVDASPDLRSARVFIRVAGDKKAQNQAAELLEEQRGHIQRLVSEQLNIKFTPKLKFVVGGGLNADSDDVERLLANLHRPQA